MPRKRRIEIEGGVYHVYNRVASGEEVFADPEEALVFLDLIRHIKKRDGWTVFAWCVMSNHYHLAVRTSAVPLWRGMHHIQCTYSRSYNRRSGRTGLLVFLHHLQLPGDTIEPFLKHVDGAGVRRREGSHDTGAASRHDEIRAGYQEHGCADNGQPKRSPHFRKAVA